MSASAFRPLCLTALVLAAWLGLCVYGCTPGEGESPARRDPAPGVTPDTITVGSSLPLEGHAGSLGVQTLTGALAYIHETNERGGVHGRRIEVIAYNDSYDPPSCLANTQRLIVEDRVFSLFCYVGTPTTVKVLPLIRKAGIPLVGMFTGANALRHPYNPYLINVRASYYRETENAVDHLVKDLDIRKIGVFYQYDAYGFDGLTGTELALKGYGLAPVARGSYIRGTLDVEEPVERIAESGAEAVVLIGTYAPCARFIEQSLARGFRPVFYTVSFVGADDLAELLPKKPPLVIMSQAVPSPETADSALMYKALLAKWFPGQSPGFVGLEGFINARVLVEGLRRAGPRLSREGFLEAVRSMTGFQMGPEVNVSFGPGDNQGMDRVFFTVYHNGRFRLIQDWGEVRKRYENRRQRAAAPEPDPAMSGGGTK